MKINYWISCAIFSVGLNVCAATPQPQFDAIIVGQSSTPPISSADREELQQLRLEKEIDDRVRTEVDRAFGHSTTLINILLFLMTLFPLVAALGIWLLRRSIINQIAIETKIELEREVQKQLATEVADEFKKQAIAFQQEMEKLEREFVSHLSQLQGLFIDAQQEKDRIIQELSKLRPASIKEKVSPEVQQKIVDLTHKLEVLKTENTKLFFTADDYVKQGDALFFEERYEDALESYDKALTIVPEEADIWFVRAYALQKLNRYDDAIASYNKTIEIHPDEMDNWYYMACCYALQGNVERAVEILQQAIYLNPRCIKWAKSNPDFDKIRNDDRFINLLDGGDLGTQKVSLDRIKLESSKEEKELSAKEYLERGNAHFAEGSYAEANNSYNQAVKVDRDFAEARYQNARAYAMRHSVNPAIGNLQWAIDIHPEYKEIAKTDSAFDELREDEQFKKITAIDLTGK